MYFNLHKNYDDVIIVSGIYEINSFDYDLNIIDRIVCQNPIQKFYYDEKNNLKIADINNIIYSNK